MFNFRLKDKEHAVDLTISTRTIIRILALVFVWFLALAALHKITHALLLIFTAFFLALALNAPVHYLAEHLPGKRRGSRGLATGISFLVIVLLLGGFLASVMPPLIRQTNNFIHAAPRLVDNVHNQNTSLGHFIEAHHLQSQANRFSQQLSDRLKNATGTAVSTLSSITSSIFATLTTLVLTFMMLIEGPRWLSVTRRLLPEDKKPHIERIGRRMYQVIRGYVNGQILLAVLVAVMLLPMLLVLHISYPIALMVVIFICGLIPLVGHIIGAVIVSLVALFHSPFAAIIILLYYILYMQIEAYVIQPKIQANSTNLTPLLVFGAVIIGVNFDGLFGGLVAIPLAGCIKVVVVDYLNRHQLLETPDVAATEETLPKHTSAAASK